MNHRLLTPAIAVLSFGAALGVAAPHPAALYRRWVALVALVT